MHTQVAIIGAGPAGLFLSHLLKEKGVESVILEGRSRDYVEGRVRAGVLEAGTIDTMERLGLAERMHREGMVDNGLDIRFNGRTIHFDLPAMTGRSVMIYGQQEVVKDLIAARVRANDPLIFEAPVNRIEGIEGDKVTVHYEHAGTAKTLTCDYVAGCDGFHGVGRASMPKDVLKTFQHVYDFAWFGILARARPLHEMTYSNHDRGFALCSRRSLSVSRLYLQVPADEKIENWSDDRFWNELHTRMYDTGNEIVEGEIFQRDLAQLRAFVAEPMRHGRLFIAGDAAHIVPPTGAKGLNAAVADVRVLAKALGEFYRDGSTAGIDTYSRECVERVWRVVRYSTHMSALLHRFDHTPMDRNLQLADLETLSRSRAAQTAIAEQYVALNSVND
ncbi:MAG: 4-hydroxybenzoate 3-monooxygenase [Rhizobiales bacterium 62-17]|nr:4-hydroxybenzoate 3-monooxygenase [Hyphomicrobiales bacterium]OJY00107.1 MAG: 4-hydroxybenzoate 3-monooxygenase [Rhizobiales bacterium 62-17]